MHLCVYALTPRPVATADARAARARAERNLPLYTFIQRTAGQGVYLKQSQR